MQPNHTTNDIPYGYCHCGCGQKTRINKYAHEPYAKGEPMRFVRNHDKRLKPKKVFTEADFWAKVDRRGPDECWEWQGPRNVNGYGFDRDARHFGQFHMHRVAFMYANGPILDGLHCLHGCDNRPCCNPAHLFLGTNDDNIADKVAKQRQPRGKTHGIAKLTPEQVKEIRVRHAQGGVYMRELGEQYGVSRSTISSVLRRVNWEWIE